MKKIIPMLLFTILLSSFALAGLKLDTENGVYYDNHKVSTRTADVVVCKLENAITGGYLWSECDVVCTNTDTDYTDDIKAVISPNTSVYIRNGDYQINISNVVKFSTVEYYMFALPSNSEMRGESKHGVKFNVVGDVNHNQSSYWLFMVNGSNSGYDSFTVNFNAASLSYSATNFTNKFVEVFVGWNSANDSYFRHLTVNGVNTISYTGGLNTNLLGIAYNTYKCPECSWEDIRADNVDVGVWITRHLPPPTETETKYSIKDVYVNKASIAGVYFEGSKGDNLNNLHLTNCVNPIRVVMGQNVGPIEFINIDGVYIENATEFAISSTPSSIIRYMNLNNININKVNKNNDSQYGYGLYLRVNWTKSTFTNLNILNVQDYGIYTEGSDNAFVNVKVENYSVDDVYSSKKAIDNLFKNINGVDYPYAKGVSSSYLVTYLPYDGNLVDYSGNNKQFTLNSSSVYPDGKIGDALYFNGLTNYINATVINHLNRTNSWAILMWVNLSSTSNQNLLSHNVNSNNRIAITVNGNITAGVYNGSTYLAIKTSKISAATWHHIAYVYYGNGSADMYIDGTTLRGTSSNGPFSASNASFVIGARSDYSFKFGGQMDELLIFNTSITQDEVISIYSKNQELISKDAYVMKNGGTATNLVFVSKCSGTCSSGEISWNSTNICVCVSADTWKTAALS